jgi:hypothetical protein
VYFEIDPDVKSPGTTPNEMIEAGMLVKSVDLPKFTVDSKTMNSYNKQTVVQTKVKYDPVNITFHDDSADRVRTLWAKYYSYYYRDMDAGVDRTGAVPLSLTDQNGRYDATRTANYGFAPLQPAGKERAKHFIKFIKIYSLHQQRFSEYILVNPIITSFKHGQHEAGKGEPMQHEMTVAYEFALYSTGRVSRDTETVAGFAKLHYDKSPSALNPANPTASILGPGGLFSSADGVISALPDNPLGAAFLAYRGISSASTMDLKQVALGELTNYGMDVLRGDNPLNKISVPSISNVVGSVSKAVSTGVDAVTNKFSSSPTNSAGTSLAPTILPVPTGTITNPDQ